jgi:hypothetical protein
MIEIKLKSGFSCEIDEVALDDWELLELFQQIDDGQPQKILKVAPKLLGKEQTDALKDHLRTDAGRVPMSAMINAIREIMDEVKAGKNS